MCVCVIPLRVIIWPLIPQFVCIYFSGIFIINRSFTRLLARFLVCSVFFDLFVCMCVCDSRFSQLKHTLLRSFIFCSPNLHLFFWSVVIQFESFVMFFYNSKSRRHNAFIRAVHTHNNNKSIKIWLLRSFAYSLIRHILHYIDVTFDTFFQHRQKKFDMMKMEKRRYQHII